MLRLSRTNRQLIKSKRHIIIVDDNDKIIKNYTIIKKQNPPICVDIISEQFSKMNITKKMETEIKIESEQLEQSEQSEQSEQLEQLEQSEQNTTTPQAPNDIFIDMIQNQNKKEEKSDIWKDSPYKHLVKLQSNNVGNVGETFIQKICDICEIPAHVDGSKTKKIGGGIGDGVILSKSVEIKTSHRGCSSPNFQHELGETPWNAEFMIFIDVAPICIYITIFKNFNEDFYKNGLKCEPYFPTKSITWRKGSGAFKLDTTIKINEDNIIKNYTFKIDNTINLHALKAFIISKIE